jgi:phosphoglycolate phosphatase-like HAD superfamily hydrolase
VRGRLRIIKDALWRQECGLAPLMAGVTLWLPLIAAHYPVAIATTAERSYVEVLLSRHALQSHVTCIVTDSDVCDPKPSPDMLMITAKGMEIGCESLCMVGDTITDYQMSCAAGSPFVLLGEERGRGIPNSCVLAKSWDELAAILLR